MKALSIANIKIDGLLERLNMRRSSSVGVAFSGGGTRGFSHIGALLAFERFGIKPDIVAGVSAGSIAAVLYAAGLSPLEMRQCFAEASNMADFREWTVPKDGIFKLTKFGRILESWLPVKNLEDLSIPCVVCATNLDRGTQVAWAKGEISQRVVASCSIPIVFKPVVINGSHYVDGGVLHNLPAWAIRDYCDVLYGINCSPVNQNYQYKDSLIDVALRSYHLMAKANLIPDIRLCDYVITPRELSTYKTFDLSALDQAIKIGYEATCRVLEAALNNKNQSSRFIRKSK